MPNWEDKDQVIAFAKRLGKGQTVFQDEGRKSYGITHTSREDLINLPGRKIIFQT